MAVLAVAAAGAVAGSAIGGAFLGLSATAWGWTIGSLVGNALFGPKTNAQGPRLESIRFSQSSYGATLPIVLGAMRVGGNVIWMGEVREITNRQKVGKNAYSTTYSYLQSFAVALADGPIAGVRKLWLDSELVYDVTAGSGLSSVMNSGPLSEQLTFYLGDESQLPDPLIEAAEGVGNVPAYRGVAYVVFDELDLTKYGNRVPNITAEVIESATFAAPTAVSAYGFGSGRYASQLVNDIVVTVNYPHEPNYTGAGSGPFWKQVARWRTDGTQLDVEWVKGIDQYPYGSSGVAGAARSCVNDVRIAYGSYTENYDDPQVQFLHGRWLIGDSYTDAGELFLGSEKMSGVANYNLSLGALMRNETHIYGFSTFQSTVPQAHPVIMRWPMAGEFPSVTRDAEVNIFSLPGAIVGAGGGGYLYVDGDRVYAKTSMTHSSIQTWIWVFDLDLNHVGTIKNYSGSTPPQFDTFAVWNGQLLFCTQYNNGTWTLTQGTIAYDGGGEGTVTATGSTVNSNVAWFPEDPRYLPVSPGLFLSSSHEISMVPAMTAAGRTLAQVITALAARANISASDLDVSQCTGITVDGFLLDRRSSVRSALEPLLSAYGVDAVESNGKIAFRTRGGAPVATIQYADLGAGNDPNPDATVVAGTREQAAVLPQQVDVIYADAAAAYEAGTQTAGRGLVLSEQQMTVTLPVAMTAQAASRAANRILYETWAARSRREFSTAMAYAALEPADPVYVEAENGTLLRARILSKTEDDGILRWEVVDDDDGVPTQIAAGASLPAPAPIATPASEALLHVFESPPLNEDDATVPVIYAAALAVTPASWEGAFLWRNSVNDTDFSVLGDLPDYATGGYTLTALPAWTTQRMMSDPLAVDVQLLSGSLASATDGELAAGANTAIVGSELLQFRTVASLGSGQYRLSGLRRAVRGTDAAAAAHVAYERFVVIDDAVLNAQRPVADIGLSHEYRAVAPRRQVTDSVAKAWTLAGRSLFPLKPGHVTIVRQANGDRTINWRRRVRIRQMWRDYVDMPLIETTEKYQVRLYNPYTGTTLRTTEVTGTTTHTYTAAQINADWSGGLPITIGVGITQYSDAVGYQDETNVVLDWPRDLNIRFGRDWNDGLTTGQTYFSSDGGASHGVLSGAYRAEVAYFDADIKSRFDNVSSFTDGFIEADLYSDAGGVARISSLLARTTSWWTGGNNGFGWECFVTNGSIGLAFGSNSGTSARTVVAQTSANSYPINQYLRIGYRFSGTTHQVYVNGQLVHNITNANHTGSGQVGVRNYGFRALVDNYTLRY